MENTTEYCGLSLAEKKAFVRGTLSVMAQYTFGVICSVIGVADSKMGRHYGSALRCKLDGRPAILTALHVVEEAKKEPFGLAISTGSDRLPYVVDGPVHIDPMGDLAVYFLPPDFPDSGENLWPSTRIDRSLGKLATDYLFLHGFPGTRSYSSRLLGGIVSRSLPYGAMQRLENLPADLGQHQFAIEYDPVGMVSETGASEDAVDPHGLSGSPVWRIGASGRRSLDWTPDDCLLVGVVTQWRPAENILVATSTERLPPQWCRNQGQA